MGSQPTLQKSVTVSSASHRLRTFSVLLPHRPWAHSLPRHVVRSQRCSHCAVPASAVHSQDGLREGPEGVPQGSSIHRAGVRLIQIAVFALYSAFEATGYFPGSGTLNHDAPLQMQVLGPSSSSARVLATLGCSPCDPCTSCRLQTSSCMTGRVCALVRRGRIIFVQPCLMPTS